MKTIKISLLLFAFVISFGCNKEKEPSKTNTAIGNIENPLTDLPWLKKIVDTHVGKDYSSIEIERCTYNNDKIGFLIDECIHCSERMSILYNCGGEELCHMGGFTGENTCKDLDIDTASVKLIFKVEQGVVTVPAR